jgi:hypothetical protein
LDPSSSDVLLLPDVVADSIPFQRRKIIPKTNNDHQQQYPTVSTKKQECSGADEEEEEEDQVDLQSDSNIGAKTFDQWRQIGRDLRIIADTFSSSSPSSSTNISSRSRSSNQQSHPTAGSISSSTWIWNVLLQGVVVYVGWKVHRWTSG